MRIKYTFVAAAVFLLSLILRGCTGFSTDVKTTEITESRTNSIVGNDEIILD